MAGADLSDLALGLATSGSGRPLPDAGFITAGEIDITLDAPDAARLAEEIVVACSAHDALARATRAAAQALRSYQYGNTAPDLAREVANACDAALAQMEGR